MQISKRGDKCIEDTYSTYFQERPHSSRNMPAKYNYRFEQTAVGEVLQSVRSMALCCQNNQEEKCSIY